eukprot:3104893-Prymnesium_polylepis.1
MVHLPAKRVEVAERGGDGTQRPRRRARAEPIQLNCLSSGQILEVLRGVHPTRHQSVGELHEQRGRSRGCSFGTEAMDLLAWGNVPGAALHFVLIVTRGAATCACSANAREEAPAAATHVHYGSRRSRVLHHSAAKRLIDRARLAAQLRIEPHRARHIRAHVRTVVVHIHIGVELASSCDARDARALHASLGTDGN